MQLSLEVKGHFAQLVADIFSWDKLKILAMRIGVDPKPIKQNEMSKRSASAYILQNLPTGRGDLAIKVILEMAKRGAWDQDYSGEVYEKINPTMERTMRCQIDREGNVIPIFETALEITEKQTYIERKLEELGFDESLANYRDAFRTYKTSSKGSISLLRSTIESLTDEILNLRGIRLGRNQKDKLNQLKEIEVLKDIESPICQKCGHKKRDAEFNFAYDLYSLLSHYGSHSELITEDLANLLFTSTSTFIWFLIARCE